MPPLSSPKSSERAIAPYPNLHGDDRFEGEWTRDPDDLAQRRRLERRRDRPALAAARLSRRDLAQCRRGGDGDPRHVGARRAADRRDRGLRRCARHARGPERRQPRRRLGNAARDPADGDQPALGARRRSRPAPPDRAGRARRGGLCRGRRDRRRGRREQPRHRPPRARDHPSHRGDEEARRASQHPHPLQRRLARDRRLRHRDGADLPRNGGGDSGPRLCRRDPAAQSGRVADRLGVRQSRNAARP